MTLASLLPRLTVIMVLTYVPVIGQTGRDLSTKQEAVAGTEWRLISLGRIGAATGVVGEAPVTLKFESDGRVNGSGGCNSFRGSYLVQGDRITFSQVLSTKRACIAADANRQESQYFSALQTANRFRMASRQLAIYYEGGRSMLDFSSETPTTEEPESTDEGDNPLAALRNYYAAINARNYRRAYRLWESPSQTLDQFIRGFAELDNVRVLVEPSPQIEGAAGSSYANVTTLVVSRQVSGAERLFAGCYVMRKPNLGDERSSRRGWRIYRANVVPVSGRISSALGRQCGQ